MLNNPASTERPRDRRGAGLYEINGNGTIHRAQDTGRNFDNARKGSRVANRTNPFWTVPSVRAEVLCSAERVQRLALLRAMFVAKALRVKRAVEMIAGVWVPSAIRPRHHDENLSFLRTPHPQCEPKVRAFPNCHRVQMFAWKRSELHQTDLGAGALADLIEHRLVLLQHVGRKSYARTSNSLLSLSMRDLYTSCVCML